MKKIIANKKAKKRGFTAGAWDLLHAGHMLLFKEAKDNCDYLIIGLHRDPSQERPHKNSPVLSVKERRILLEGCRYIDEIVEYDTEADLLLLLKTLNLDIRFMGDDYLTSTSYTGYGLPIHMHYVDRSHGFSSSGVRKRVESKKSK